MPQSDDYYDDTPKKLPSKKDNLGLLWAVLIGAGLAIIINIFFIQMYQVPSGSMEPTLKAGDYMISVPIIDNSSNPGRGDVVVFKTPSEWNSEDVFVKRVIGVGGDTVSYDPATQTLFINGEPQTEDYIHTWTGKNYLDENGWEYVVPEGHYFMMGDNRDFSLDSRAHPENPFVPKEFILGQPFLKVWPFDRIGAL